MNQPRIRDAGDSSALDEAVDILGGGGVVALPTETVYGLAGSCLDPQAIQSIYQLKGRPSNNPLIAHVLDVEQAQGIIAAGGFNALALELAQKFWPGPLTMVLPRAEGVPAPGQWGARFDRGAFATAPGCQRDPAQIWCPLLGTFGQSKWSGEPDECPARCRGFCRGCSVGP